MANRKTGIDVGEHDAIGLSDTDTNRKIGRYAILSSWSSLFGLPVFVITYLIALPAGSLFEKFMYFFTTLKVFCAWLLNAVGIEGSFFSCDAFLSELKDACTNADYFKFAMDNGFSNLIGSLLLAIAISTPAFIYGWKWRRKIYKARAKKMGEKTHISGNELHSVKEIEEKTAWWAENDPNPTRSHEKTVPFGESHLTVCTENTGTVVIGATGAGKTEAIRPMLNKLRNDPKKPPVLIYDFGLI